MFAMHFNELGGWNYLKWNDVVVILTKFLAYRGKIIKIFLFFRCLCRWWVFAELIISRLKKRNVRWRNGNLVKDTLVSSRSFDNFRADNKCVILEIANRFCRRTIRATVFSNPDGELIFNEFHIHGPISVSTFNCVPKLQCFYTRRFLEF